MKFRRSIVFRTLIISLAVASFYLCCAPSRSPAADPAGSPAAAGVDGARKPKAISREAALYWERYQSLQGDTPGKRPPPTFVGNKRLDAVEKTARVTAAEFETVRKALADATDRYERLLKRTEAIEKGLAPRLSRLEATVGSAADALTQDGASRRRA